MTLKATSPAHRHIAAVLLALAVSGCAATIGQDGLAQRTSLAIGREVGSFTISDQRPDTGGRIDYSVKTKDGAQYRCYMYSATGFQSVMSFGQIPHSDAICTKMGPGAAPAEAAKTPSTCNALLKAAGRC